MHWSKGQSKGQVFGHLGGERQSGQTLYALSMDRKSLSSRESVFTLHVTWNETAQRGGSVTSANRRLSSWRLCSSPKGRWARIPFSFSWSCGGLMGGNRQRLWQRMLRGFSLLRSPCSLICKWIHLEWSTHGNMPGWSLFLIFGWVKASACTVWQKQTC